MEEGKIRNDEYQRKILGSLQDLYSDLQKYKHVEHSEKSSVLSKLGSLLGSKTPVSAQPHGIYLWGGVGCGKTMLMDMFYTTIPDHLSKKRIHFHAFMQDVHKKAHRLHEKFGEDFDTAPIISQEIAKEANVLCFDEFQVVDIADAMMLRRIIDLFYTKNGVVTFMTSNRSPDDLYQDGIQRKSFIPCIEQIKSSNKVIHLNSATDYRKIDRPNSGNYFFPPDGKSLHDSEIKARADEHTLKWFEYFGNGGQPLYNTTLEVWGRPILIPKSIPNKVAQFTFDDLCEHALSAADYLEITKHFPSIVVTDIPILSTRQTDFTRRFITFLDASYDSKTKLAATAERPFDDLFTGADLTTLENVCEDSEKILGDTHTDSDFLSNASFFTGEEEKFAYARTLSRLRQMSSKQWLDQLVIS